MLNVPIDECLRRVMDAVHVERSRNSGSAPSSFGAASASTSFAPRLVRTFAVALDQSVLLQPFEDETHQLVRPTEFLGNLFDVPARKAMEVTTEPRLLCVELFYIHQHTPGFSHVLENSPLPGDDSFRCLLSRAASGSGAAPALDTY